MIVKIIVDSKWVKIGNSLCYVNIFEKNYIQKQRCVILDLLFRLFDNIKVRVPTDLLCHNSIYHTACEFDVPTSCSPSFFGAWRDYNNADFRELHVNVAQAQFYKVIYSAMSLWYISKLKQYILEKKEAYKLCKTTNVKYH